MSRADLRRTSWALAVTLAAAIAIAPAAARLKPGPTTGRRPALTRATATAVGPVWRRATTGVGPAVRRAESIGAFGRAAPLTFTHDIAPVVFDRCGRCHHPDGPAPFSLLTYAAVRQRARQIVDVTRRRYMPPWKGEPFGAFVGQDPLSDAEIATIQRWVDEGAVEGSPAALPSPPKWTAGWQLGKPDLVVTLSEPYMLQADGSDVFRIFVVPLPVGGVQYVRGLEFLPGNARVVHHANIRIDRTPKSRALDAEDPAPGYDGLIAHSAVYPDGHFLGWTPGQVAPLVPKGLAWRLDPGTDLVVQLHMQPSGKREGVQPSIGLFFGGDPPARAPAMLRLGRQGIDMAAGEKQYTITDSYVLPVDVEVQAVQPHAHYRARDVRGWATRPDGTTKLLVSIGDWDFRWQHVYRYIQPFVLPRGTTLAMRYTYDNSAENPRNPVLPPQRVRWGQRSRDEMGDLWIQVLTNDASDLATLNRGFRPKVAAEDIIGYETAIEAEPTSAPLHDDVALLYLEAGRAAEAVAHFEASARLKPGSAAAHFNLATALTVAGRLDQAVAEYQEALTIDPAYVNAHNNLGGVLAAQGRFHDATGQYREALRLDPRHAEAHNNLGRMLMELGNADEAFQHFRDALRLNPESADAHFNIGRAYRRLGRRSDAIRHVREALRLQPDWAPALAELASLLGEKTLR